MSPVFKTLTNVAVWMLFVTGCWVILTSLPFPYRGYNSNWMNLVVGVADLVLAVVIMKMKQTIEIELPTLLTERTGGICHENNP
jgi:hypothetical protein